LIAQDPGDLDAPPARFPFRLSSVDEAVAAARRAWPGWAALPDQARHAALRRFAGALDQRGEEAAGAIVAEMGKHPR
jgi:aldehyde dehydrogenase (NAD+)